MGKEVIAQLELRLNNKKLSMALEKQKAHNKEIFGAPTFVVNNKIFWGQDRLEYALEEYSK